MVTLLLSPGNMTYSLTILFFLAVLFIFLHMKSKDEQGKYFQELSNSFEDSALVCDFTGKVLFANKTFIYLHGPKLIPINEFLDISDLRKMPLGTDTRAQFKDGRNCDYVVYKLMNRTSQYQEELFVILIKESE